MKNARNGNIRTALTLGENTISKKREDGDKSHVGMVGDFRVQFYFNRNKESIERNHIVGDMASEISKTVENMRNVKIK